jgi:hypothetical protein
MIYRKKPVVFTVNYGDKQETVTAWIVATDHHTTT